jgi:protein TonB
MRFALPGSALVHASVIGSLFLGVTWQHTQDAAAPAPVAVSIISVSTAIANESETLESDSFVTAISAGNLASSDAPAELLQPVPPEEAETEVAEVLVPVPAEVLTPSESEITELTTDDAETELVSALAPLQAEPIEVAELVEAVEQAVSAMPTARDQRPKDQPEKSRENQMRREAAQRPRPTQAGNGGDSGADSMAAARPQVAAAASNSGTGGEAEVAKYPSQVMNKIRSSIRRIGQNGEAWVRFTVQANGRVSDVSVIKTSGKTEVDTAALALIQRAAPFPTIPAAANRATWTFELPLAFERR